MMNDALVKSYDNIMDQQNKMDNKAYVFIGFISFVILYFYPNSSNFNYATYLLLVIAIPLVISLLPIATRFSIKVMKSFCIIQQQNTINIFYYIDLYCLDDKKFIELFNKEYKPEKISLSDKKLIQQIIINAKILKIKVFWHSLSQIFIVILIVSSIIFSLLD